ARSLAHGPARRPRTVLARGQVPLPPVSVWPRAEGTDAPASARPVLPAPSPHSFSYPGEVSEAKPLPLKPGAAPPQPIKRPDDPVPQTNGCAKDLRRLIDNMVPEDGPTGTIAPASPGRGPAATANMPRGAYP